LPRMRLRSVRCRGGSGRGRHGGGRSRRRGRRLRCRPHDRVVGGGPRWGDGAKGHTLRAVSSGDLAQPGRGEVEGFVPTDALPAGVGIAFRPGGLQGIAQAVRVADEFRRGPPFGAEDLAGGVRWIRFESGETAVLDDNNGTAARDAQGAVAPNPFGRLRRIYLRITSLSVCLSICSVH